MLTTHENEFRIFTGFLIVIVHGAIAKIDFIQPLQRMELAGTQKN